MSQERFEQRRRDERRRSVKRWSLVGAGIVAVLGLAWLFLGSSVLAASSVDVEGTDLLTADEVRAVAAVPLDRPLARLDTAAVEERVRALPQVQDVEVSRSWPRTVTISITERTAVGWITVDGQMHGIDRDGVDFRTFDEAPGVTELRVATTDPKLREKALEGLGAMLATLRAHDPALVGQIAFAAAESQDSLTFTFADGRLVRWGSGESSDDKLTVLTALLGSVQAAEYDVSAPEQPTTRD